ncbi:hypothetical protein JCM9279_005078 [Rhodotorula babjevae]
MQQPDTGQHHPPAPDYHTHDLAHLRPNPPRQPHPLHQGQGQAPPPPPPPPTLHLARPPMPSSYSTTHALAHQRQYAHPQPHPHSPQVQFHPQQQHAPQPQQQQQQDSRTQLFVSNLPFRARWQDLKDLMRKCGTVLRADVALNPTDGRSRGFGVVLFAKADDAHKAIATYHGYTWQTRVLDVRIDAQDPTGALALAEANRQQAMQNQQKLLEQRARNSPVPPPPPPPAGGLPYGAMLVPVPGLPGQAYLAAPPPPPSSAPGSEPAPSPYLSPAVIRTSSQDNASRRSPSPARSPSGPPSSASPASTLATPTDLSPGAAVAADPLLALGGKRVTPPLAPRSPTLHPPAPPRHLDYPQQQQHHDSGPHGGYPSQGQGQARAQDVPPQLQHALALVPPPPPPPMPMQVQVQLGHHHQPMLVPMVSMHPMGYAVPGGLVGYYAAAPPQHPHAHGGGGGPARPGSAQPHLMHPHGGGPGGPGGGGPGAPGYQNRHLFVGNLPFNCQWQELKDLMRGAGSVLRADIAQGPDGRSRGFGSVLFGTSQDAERAVGMFNGFEFNGRTLKVHFDKFSGAAVNTPQHAHAPPPQHQHQPHYSGQHGPPPPPPPPYNRQQQQYAPPGPIPYRPQTLEHLVSQPAPNGPSPLSGLAHSSSGEHDYPSRPGTATTRRGSSDERSARSPPAPSSSSQQAPSSPALASLPDPSQGVTAPTASTTSPPAPSFVRGHSNPAAPSRIAMPPPLPFSLASLGHPSSAAGGPHSASSPFSPMRTAGLPPMTPSMPAFTFGGAGPFAAQMTPPLLPHGMFSPGVGPFSPGTPGGGGGGGAGGGPMSPFFGPGGAWGHTVAPGQQTPGGFNPMFPAYPYTPGHHLPPHAMQQHQYAAVPQHASFPEEHELEHAQAHAYEQQQHEHEQQQHAVAVNADSTYGESSPEKTPQADEPSYFPPVLPPPSAPSHTESAPVLSATSASAPPLSPSLGAPEGEAGVAGGRPKSEGAGASGPLERAMDALSVNGGGPNGAGAGTRSLHSSPRMAAPHVVAPQPVHPPPVPEVGWAEGSPPPPVEKELAPVAAGARRASVDGGSGGGKPAFGTSIWG